MTGIDSRANMKTDNGGQSNRAVREVSSHGRRLRPTDDQELRDLLISLRQNLLALGKTIERIVWYE